MRGLCRVCGVLVLCVWVCVRALVRVRVLESCECACGACCYALFSLPTFVPLLCSVAAAVLATDSCISALVACV